MLLVIGDLLSLGAGASVLLAVFCLARCILFGSRSHRRISATKQAEVSPTVPSPGALATNRGGLPAGERRGASLSKVALLQTPAAAGLNAGRWTGGAWMTVVDGTAFVLSLASPPNSSLDLVGGGGDGGISG